MLPCCWLSIQPLIALARLFFLFWGSKDEDQVESWGFRDDEYTEEKKEVISCRKTAKESPPTSSSSSSRETCHRRIFQNEKMSIFPPPLSDSFGPAFDIQWRHDSGRKKKEEKEEEKTVGLQAEEPYRAHSFTKEERVRLSKQVNIGTP